MKGKIPPVLSDKKIKQANERVLSRHGIPCEPITIEDVIRIGDKLRLKIIEEQGIERLEAQRDADVDWFKESKCGHCDTPLLREGELYEKLEQAKEEVAREIFERIEKVENPYSTNVTHILEGLREHRGFERGRQKILALKSKHLKG